MLIDGCIARGIIPVAFSPLGHGGAVLGDPVLADIAAKHGVSVAQVCLKWNLQRGVAVIPHTLDPSELAENMSLAGDGHTKFTLSAEDMGRIARLDRGERCLVLDWGETDPGPLLSKRQTPPCPVQQPPLVAHGVLRLWHTPTSRSSRCLWMIEELREAYAHSSSVSSSRADAYSGGSGASNGGGDDTFPNEKEISTVLPRVELQGGAGAMFAMAKPDWYLELNPNGNVITLVCVCVCVYFYYVVVVVVMMMMEKVQCLVIFLILFQWITV